MGANLTVEWRDAGREPQCPPNSDFPTGIDVDISGGAQANCTASLPYPAKRIGTYIVRCSVCGTSAGCTTAGRSDDPRSIKIACKTRGTA